MTKHEIQEKLTHVYADLEAIKLSNSHDAAMQLNAIQHQLDVLDTLHRLS